MSVVPVVDILQGRIAVDSKATVYGWVHTRRDSKADISFLVVHDGSCFDPIQTIINNSLPNYNQDVLRPTTSCSVIVTDKVVASPGQGQSLEIQATEVKVISWVEDPDTYPMAAKRHSIKCLREMTHICPRADMIGAVARVRHSLAQAPHRFLYGQDFFWVLTPLIIASDTRGAGEVFRISTLDLENLPRNDQGKVDFDKDLFGKGAFLTVSGQPSGETYACALSKIYTFGPTFHAENSSTSHHLAEFWMLEPEVTFTDLNGVIGLAKAMLKYVFRVALTEHADDMKFFTEHIDKDAISRLERFISADLAQVDYTDVVSILEKRGKQFKNPVYWGVNLSSEYERYPAEEHFKAPVVVKNYPKDIKAFYMRLNEDGRTVVAVDILALGTGEVIGSPQREERLDVLDTRMLEMGLNKEDCWRYRDLRRYGTVPHSDFGLGLERLIAYATGVQNVRDVIPFPCAPYGATFQTYVIVLKTSIAGLFCTLFVLSGYPSHVEHNLSISSTCYVIFRRNTFAQRIISNSIADQHFLTKWYIFRPLARHSGRPKIVTYKIRTFRQNGEKMTLAKLNIGKSYKQKQKREF